MPLRHATLFTIDYLMPALISPLEAATPPLLVLRLPRLFTPSLTFSRLAIRVMRAAIAAARYMIRRAKARSCILPFIAIDRRCC